ncbi:MAG: ribbon-helix-helix domain-containing protein [Candidatus Bathyarchaeia archaeon]
MRIIVISKEWKIASLICGALIQMPNEKVEMKYTTVHIPNTLARLIDKLIESEQFAYSSRSEFVKDAIRRFLEYHGYYPQSGISLEKAKITINPSLTKEDLENSIAEMNSKIKMLNDLKSCLMKNADKS